MDTVDGKVIYEVKPGTQTDTKSPLKGQGCTLSSQQGGSWRPLCNTGGSDTGEAFRRGEGIIKTVRCVNRRQLKCG